MENLNCDIIEKKNCADNVNISEILQLVNNNSFLDYSHNSIDEQMALELDYCNNYTSCN